MAASRLSQVACEHGEMRERERENEMESRRSGQNGTRDKRIRMEIRERGREIGRVSERKNAKGKKQEENEERDRRKQRYRRGEEDAWKTWMV